MVTTFSERHGYMPDRTQLHQLEGMDARLKTAIWNFLLRRYFGFATHAIQAQIEYVWTEFLGRRLDTFPRQTEAELRRAYGGQIPFSARESLQAWYWQASWNQVYDLLEFLLRDSQRARDAENANSILEREGSAYRFVGGWLTPITNDEELCEVESAIRLSDPFHGAAQHIEQAVVLLSDRDNPDARNAIKEAISAVETAVSVVQGRNVSLEKGLSNLDVHPQLAQAWTNMYRWTSDEEGVRHGMKETPQVGLDEARYMVVASSAFVNYLVTRKSGS